MKKITVAITIFLLFFCLKTSFSFGKSLDKINNFDKLMAQLGISEVQRSNMERGLTTEIEKNRFISPEQINTNQTVFTERDRKKEELLLAKNRQLKRRLDESEKRNKIILAQKEKELNLLEKENTELEKKIAKIEAANIRMRTELEGWEKRSDALSKRAETAEKGMEKALSDNSSLKQIIEGLKNNYEENSKLLQEKIELIYENLRLYRNLAATLFIMFAATLFFLLILILGSRKIKNRNIFLEEKIEMIKESEPITFSIKRDEKTEERWLFFSRWNKDKGFWLGNFMIKRNGEAEGEPYWENFTSSRQTLKSVVKQYIKRYNAGEKVSEVDQAIKNLFLIKLSAPPNGQEKQEE